MEILKTYKVRILILKMRIGIRIYRILRKLCHKYEAKLKRDFLKVDTAAKKFFTKDVEELNRGGRYYG